MDTSPAERYVSEEVTQAPGQNQSLQHAKTLQSSQSGIHFIQENDPDLSTAVSVIPRHDSDLMKAVQRLGSITPAALPISRQTAPPRGAEYQALLLMYRVSALLAAATDLDEFVGQLSDLVLEEVRADTVVLLTLAANGELVPQVIRHRGVLTAGEVPVSRGIVDRVVQERVAVMSNDVGQDESFRSGHSVQLYKIRAVVALPLMVQNEIRGVLYISRSGLQSFSGADRDLMAAILSLLASGLERAELKEKVLREKHRRKALERFYPPEVAKRLFTQEAGEASLEEHQATVLVCDLQEFSELVSRFPPRQLAAVLHEYYEMLYEKIFANGGSLVKLHDGWALALFGAPHSPDRDAVWAVETAKELCDEFTSMSVLWPGSQSLALRCALDSGTVVAGVLGSVERLEYAAVGLPISAASTLARQALGTSISISERTLSELPKARYKVQEMPALGELRVYRLQR
jgi:class 3 adenylate cyclase